VAPREPIRPQLDFPELTADLIEQLNLKGQVGLLDFIDSVQPSFIIGIREGIGFTFTAPTFTSAGVFSDFSFAPAVNTVLADTGPLPAGNYDVKAGWSWSNQTASAGCDMQHRNAANAANLAEWPHNLQGDASVTNASFPITFGYTLALNERIRFQVTSANFSAASRVNTWIMVQRRAVP